MGALIGCHQGTVLSLIRQRGFPPDQTAEDLKQAFFARMLQRNDVARLDQARGHFRGWLKTAVSRFLFNEWKRWYRAAGTAHEPLEEDALAADTVDNDVFDIAYAWAIYRPAFDALRAEQRDPVRFEAVKRYLFGPQLDVVAYEGVAAALGMTRTNVAVLVCKLRVRQRELIAEGVAETLDVDASSPSGAQMIEDEVAMICQIVSETPEPDRA